MSVPFWIAPLTPAVLGLCYSQVDVSLSGWAARDAGPAGGRVARVPGEGMRRAPAVSETGQAADAAGIALRRASARAWAWLTGPRLRWVWITGGILFAAFTLFRVGLLLHGQRPTLGQVLAFLRPWAWDEPRPKSVP